MQLGFATPTPIKVIEFEPLVLFTKFLLMNNKNKVIWIFILSLLAWHTTLNGQSLIFNEVMYTNSIYLDEDSESYPWIEFLNTSAIAVDLDQYYISTSSNPEIKHRLPASLINPNQVALIWISGKNKAKHTASSIDLDTDSVYLLNSAFVIIDTTPIKRNLLNESYGRRATSN